MLLPLFRDVMTAEVEHLHAKNRLRNAFLKEKWQKIGQLVRIVRSFVMPQRTDVDHLLSERLCNTTTAQHANLS